MNVFRIAVLIFVFLCVASTYSAGNPAVGEDSIVTVDPSLNHCAEKARILKTVVNVPGDAFSPDFSLTAFHKDTSHADTIIISHEKMSPGKYLSDMNIIYDGASFSMGNFKEIKTLTTVVKNPSSTRIASSILTEVLREKTNEFLNEHGAFADNENPTQLTLVFDLLGDRKSRKTGEQYEVSLKTYVPEEGIALDNLVSNSAGSI